MTLDLPILIAYIECIFSHTYNPFTLFSQFAIAFIFTSYFQFLFQIYYPFTTYIVLSYGLFRFYNNSPLNFLYSVFNYPCVNMYELQQYFNSYMQYYDYVLQKSAQLDDDNFVNNVSELYKILDKIIQNNGKEIHWSQLLATQDKIYNNKNGIYFISLCLDNSNNNHLLDIHHELEEKFPKLNSIFIM